MNITIVMTKKSSDTAACIKKGQPQVLLPFLIFKLQLNKTVDTNPGTKKCRVLSK